VSERTRSILRAAVVTLIASLMLPVGAYAETAQIHAQTYTRAEPATQSRSPNIAAAIFDVVIIRPLQLGVLVVGAAAFVPVAAMTAANGRESFDTALEIFVTGPINDVFQRPLGDF
jgi:hypothetical protein